MGKYDPLRAHLDGLSDSVVVMSFRDIDQIVGGLPPSARELRPWWANVAASRSQSRAWLDAGRRVTGVDLGAEVVTFALVDGVPDRSLADTSFASDRHARTSVPGSAPHEPAKQPPVAAAAPVDSEVSTRELPTALPYPVARSVRLLRTTGDDRRRLDEVKRAMENVVVWFGVIGLAWCLEQGARPAGVRRWATGIAQGGVSNGHWIDATRDAANAAADAGAELAGYTAALQLGRKGVLGELDAFAKRRNELEHGARLRSDLDYRRAADELTEILESTLEKATFLGQAELVLAERSAFQRTGEFRTDFLLASGDHPDFERDVRSGDKPYIERGIYLLGVLPNGGDLELSPFAVSRDCTQCGTSEMYYPSRVRSDRTQLMSFDRGHRYEDHEITPDLLTLVVTDEPSDTDEPVPTSTGGHLRAPDKARAPEPSAPSRTRAPNVTTRLSSSPHLTAGTLLRFNLGAVGQRHRDEVGRWLADDPLRAVATWTGDQTKSLRWELDGSTHSLSGLAQHVLVSAADVELSLQGPLFWIDDRGVTLLEMADEPAEAEVPVDRAQADLVSAWCVVPDDDPCWSVEVRNGSEAPIYDVRAWIPQRDIVVRDPEGRWIGAMHDVVPPKREATASFEYWPLEDYISTPMVTLEFTDAQGQHWRRTERSLTPLRQRAIEPLLNEESVLYLDTI